jgi:hypothetical protein
MAAVRQHLTGTINDGATQAYAFGVRAGSKLVYLSGNSNTGQSISTITDTQGNSWAQVDDVTVSSFRFERWEATAGSTGANTITANFNSFVAAPRIWLAEVVGIGTLTAVSGTSFDQTSAQDPMTLATFTATGNGIYFVILATDSAHTFVGFLVHPVHDMSGGSSTRGGWGVMQNTESLAPTIDFSTTESGESLICPYNDSGGVGGGGETAHVFS